MSFRVKNYRSRLDWQIGKGGFGTVYAGVFSPKNGSDSGRSAGSGSSRDSQQQESLDRPLSEQVAIKLERSDHDRPCLANEARALKALQGAEGIPKFHVFAHTKITVKRRTGAQLTPIGASPSPGTGGGSSGVHAKRSPTAYKRSPLSTPVNSGFEVPIGSEWSYGYGELQRQQQLPPLAHCYQPEQATPHLHAATRLSPSRPSSPSMAVAVVETTYNALVMERLGEDIGTNFRRHLLKYVKPSAVPTLSGSGTVASTVRRRSDAYSGQLKGPCDTATGARCSERVGWNEETIAWLGCHALKRLEWVHSQGFVHRDIPENFCIGLGKKKDILYIVDFGMAQSFRTPDGQHMPRSGEDKGCVGTQAFMSFRCEGTRRDDIESLGYLLLFLYNGSLPWSKHADRFEESFARSGHRWTAESVGLNEQIALDKRALIKSRKGLEGVSPVLQSFFDHVAALGFADRPDYSALRALLRRMKSSTAATGGGKARDCHRLAGKDQGRRIGKAGAAVEPDTCKFPFRGGGGDGQHSCSHAQHIPVA